MTFGDESFMDLNLDDAIDLKALPDGTECEVEILTVTPNAEKCYVKCRMKPCGHEFTRTFTHFLFYPKPDDDPEKVNNKKLRLKEFFEAFRINQRSADGMVGHRAWVVLGLENNPEIGEVNTIKRITRKG